MRPLYCLNLCNLRNLWIKCLFGSGFAALGLSVSLNNMLSIPALSQIFRKIGQAHQDNGQPCNIRDMNNTCEHFRNDDRDKQADDGPDKKHLKLIQLIILGKPDR